MTEISLAELETAAAAYEERLVPAVFQIWTDEMLGAARIERGQRTLDVACGTGVLARAMAERVGPSGSVAGLDLNPGMLGVAKKLAPEIDWHLGEAQSLPFDESFFDAVTCQFGFMFFPDQKAALKEMDRVVAPSGHIAVAVFDGLERNDGYRRLAQVFEDQVDKTLGDAMRMPFAMGDTEALSAIFAEAGLSKVDIATKVKTERFSSLRDMVLSDVKGWFPLAGFHLDDAAVEAVTQQAETAMVPYLDPGGAVEFPVHAHIVSARKG